MTTLPNGFLWGAATAAHQIEGNNVNTDLWVSEWSPNSGFAEPSGDACDSYHRYGDDISLLAAAGLNAYRFSIDWARIEPEAGHFSRAELDHYRRMVGTCLEHGVSPMVTLQHFTGPRWFQRAGSWGSEHSANWFARYAERVTQHLGDLVPQICTINEANILCMVFATGMAPAAHEDDFRGATRKWPQAEERDLATRLASSGGMGSWPSPELAPMAAAHRAAFDAIKSVRSEVQVGWSLALVDFQSVEGGEERLAAARQKVQLDWLEVSKADDFVGVQTYSRERFGPDGKVARPAGCETTLTGWEYYPVALEHTLRLAASAGVPMYVTENGMATADDARRIDYTTEALRGMGRCIADGLDVRGYFHWTLLDNWEWMSGFGPTFGLIAVDRDTFARTPKPSLAWLGSVARAATRGEAQPWDTPARRG